MNLEKINKLKENIMELSERSIRIKSLISGQVDMGTFGLVELELIEIDKELSELKKMQIKDIKEDVCNCFISTVSSADTFMRCNHCHRLARR